MKLWQTLLLILIVSLVIAGSFTTLMIRYINARDARLINQAIHQNDLPTVQKIVQKNDINIYSDPSIQKDDFTQQQKTEREPERIIIEQPRSEERKIKKEGSSMMRSLKKTSNLNRGQESLRSKKADITIQNPL